MTALAVSTLAGSARAAIRGAVARHGRAGLLFSGGKDSIVLAHLTEPVKERVELLWANTGAMFPHMETFIRAYGARFKLV